MTSTNQVNIRIAYPSFVNIMFTCNDHKYLLKNIEKNVKLKVRNPNLKVYNAGIQKGLSHLLATVLANRIAEPDLIADVLHPDLRKHLPDPGIYTGMKKASDVLLNAITKQKRVLFAVDFDADGINSGAVLYRGLVEGFGYAPELVSVMISHKAKWGYGVSTKAVKHILDMDPLPDLVITADQGSANGKEIALLRGLAAIRGQTLEVIVTDHHEIPDEGFPTDEDVVAFINPQRDRSLTQELKDICGATVAWLLMITTFKLAEERGIPLPPDARRNIFNLVSHCAIATVSDVMSLAHPLNRAICREGFRIINTTAHPAWLLMKELNGNYPIDEGFVGFTLAPLINAASRVGLSGYEALQFLIAKDGATAAENLKHLQRANEQRKEIGKEMLDAAFEKAQKQIDEGHSAIIVYLPNGSPGVSGIVAGKLKEAFGRPAVMLAPSGEGMATGSARSIAGINIRDCLEEIYNFRSDLMPRFGGHPQAAGMLVPIEHIEDFSDILQKIIARKLSSEDLEPTIEPDFVLGENLPSFTMKDMKDIERLKPFGQHFELPNIVLEGRIKNVKPMGKKEKIHLRFELETEHGKYECTWFFARANEGEAWPTNEGDFATVSATPSINRFRGRESLQMQIHAADVKLHLDNRIAC